tara:strand:+ start:141 stop:1085 length:945 start_codon:yes stop_codon:yes gene_type:complete
MSTKRRKAKSRKTKRRKTKRIRRKIKKYKKKVKFKKENCAPKKKGETLDYTCYTKESLHKIKNIWNIKHPTQKIKTNNPRKIHKSLQYALQNTCNAESCWLKHKCIKEKIPINIHQNTFAPRTPPEWKKNPVEWLTSIDILNVMKQYELSNPLFEFIGPSPIDYDTHKAYGECVWEELCKFSLKKNIKKKKTKIGIIFNLDKHDKEGSHWIALFINTMKKKIYYLDSYGEPMPRQVKKFVKKVQKQATAIGEGTYKLLENKKRHQYSESECGMYCLYFIIQMIKGRSFNSIFNVKYKKLSDKWMTHLRKVYFNK